MERFGNQSSLNFVNILGVVIFLGNCSPHSTAQIPIVGFNNIC